MNHFNTFWKEVFQLKVATENIYFWLLGIKNILFYLGKVSPKEIVKFEQKAKKNFFSQGSKVPSSELYPARVDSYPTSLARR